MTLLVARFVIRELPPKQSQHHMLVHRAKVKWAREFGLQAMAQRMAPAAQYERRVVVVELFRPGQDMDEDNMFARMKVPLDVLSRAHGRKKIGIGAIWDDAPRFLDLRPFCVRSATTRTVVTVLLDGAGEHDGRTAAVQGSLDDYRATM